MYLKQQEDKTLKTAKAIISLDLIAVIAEKEGEIIKGKVIMFINNKDILRIINYVKIANLHAHDESVEVMRIK